MSVPQRTAIALLALAVGCTDASLPVAPAPAVSAQTSALAQTKLADLNLDTQFAEMAKRVHGFGGAYVDSDGVLTVFLKDTSQSSDAAAVVEQEWRNRWHPMGQHIAPVSKPRVRRGRFDYLELMAAYTTIIHHRFPEAITMYDIDERHNRVLLGAPSRGAMHSIKAALSRLNLPQGVVEVTLFAPVVMYANLRSYYRPTIGGMQISFGNFLCTLGFNAYRKVNGTVDQSHRYFVTNSHCTDAFGQATGTVYGQPDNAHRIGVEAVDPPLFTSAQNSLCPVGRKCRYSDAALVQYDSATGSWGLGYIAAAGYGDTGFSDNLGYNNFVGQEYRGAVTNPTYTEKVGRTTGISAGGVTGSGTCVTIPQSENGYDTGRTMLCQALAGNMSSGPGDSGSPVYFQTDYPGLPVEDPSVTLLGILWGGNGTDSVYSPFGQIEAELGPLYTLMTY